MIPEWLESKIFFIHKDGDKNDPSNYRTIAIQNAFLKVFSSIMTTRIYNYAEENDLFPTYQFGFRKNKSTTGAATLLYELANEKIKNKQKLYCCFVDFSKAFDTVDRSKLFVKLQNLGIPYKICKTVFTIFQNCKYYIKSDDELSKPYYTEKGVPQGSSVSACLFNLFVSNLPQYLYSYVGRIM